MQNELQELRETAVLWNEGRNALRKRAVIYFILIAIASFASFVFEARLKMPLLLPFWGILMLIAVIINLSKHITKKSGVYYSKRLRGVDDKRIEGFKNAIEDTYSSFEQKDPSTFDFCTLEKTFENNFNNHQQKFAWIAKAGDGYFVLCNKVTEEVYFPDFDRMKIFKGKKGLIINVYSTIMLIDDREYEITISPESYDKYLKCLEKDFEDEGREKETVGLK